MLSDGEDTDQMQELQRRQSILCKFHCALLELTKHTAGKGTEELTSKDETVQQHNGKIL